jgi:hypothetical protein
LPKNDDGWHRASYGIRPHLIAPLRWVLAEAGLRSVGALLTMLAESPQDASLALRPLADARRRLREEQRRGPDFIDTPNDGQDDLGSP